MEASKKIRKEHIELSLEMYLKTGSCHILVEFKSNSVFMFPPITCLMI
jgi:hypothetical protein